MPLRFFKKYYLEREACIDVELALLGPTREPVSWSPEFLDLGSIQSKLWIDKISESMPELHFVSSAPIFVEERVTSTLGY